MAKKCETERANQRKTTKKKNLVLAMTFSTHQTMFNGNKFPTRMIVIKIGFNNNHNHHNFKLYRNTSAFEKRANGTHQVNFHPTDTIVLGPSHCRVDGNISVSFFRFILSLSQIQYVSFWRASKIATENNAFPWASPICQSRKFFAGQHSIVTTANCSA